MSKAVGDSSDLPDAVWPSASWPLWGWKPVLHMPPTVMSKPDASELALCVLSAVWITWLLVLPMISCKSISRILTVCLPRIRGQGFKMDEKGLCPVGVPCLVGESSNCGRRGF